MITFITGNQDKADYLARYLGYPVTHRKLDLDELQSLELKDIVEHKVKQAYEIVNGPVLVEDVSLEFSALGRLPGTFIKYFVEEMPFDTICGLVDGVDRTAVARCTFGYYDGEQLELFEGSLMGRVAEAPKGENGYGWDKIFIAEGYEITSAEMDDTEYQKTYMQIKPFSKVKKFLEKKSL